MTRQNVKNQMWSQDCLMREFVGGYVLRERLGVTSARRIWRHATCNVPCHECVWGSGRITYFLHLTLNKEPNAWLSLSHRFLFKQYSNSIFITA